jgi:hypothetical protein
MHLLGWINLKKEDNYIDGEGLHSLNKPITFK